VRRDACSRAGNIGFFKILTEAGIAAGVRRIEAVTGSGALRYAQQMEAEQKNIAALLRAEGGDPAEKLEKLMGRQRELQREVETLQARLNAAKSADLLDRVTEIAGIKVLAAQVEVADPKALRDLSDSLKDRLGSGILVLGSEQGGKAALLVAVSKDLTAKYRAGDIIKSLAPMIGGSGGGKPELAQAGGNQPENISAALERVAALVG